MVYIYTMVTFLESSDECKSGLKTSRGETHKKLGFYYVIFIYFWYWYCRCEIVALVRDSTRFPDPGPCLQPFIAVDTEKLMKSVST